MNKKVAMKRTHAFELPQQDPCPFCEDIAGRRECAVVEDRADTFALVGPHQPTKGKLLIVPKRHVPTVLDLEDGEAAAVMQCVVRLSRAVTKAFSPVGLNIFQNNGVIGNQTVPHYHVHINPRYEDDSWRPGVPDNTLPRTPIAERLQIGEQIKAHL